ncbi:MAG TPA: hypothetical protein VLV86_25210 [Vicinamibacterales bacterium]|nr:hypothetical protein [Vicinamibacterales bacterium]
MLWPHAATAQSDGTRFQLGAQFASAVWGAFDSTDVGGGARFSWEPRSLLGIETELDVYPRDFASTPAFSRSRIEALFGVTVGPRLGRVRPFAKLRPGFVTFREAPAPFACIAIFPPPLSCTLGAGATVFALDAGGGLEWLWARRTFLRVDISDRLMKYPGSALDTNFSHDFRFALGAGVRF